MTTAELDTTEFEADWNPGGTYGTAFHVPEDGSTTATPDTSTRIYVAEVESTFKGTTGHVVTLKPRHTDGKELRLWLQNGIKSVPTGQHLWDALDAGLIKPGMLAFALGKFLRQVVGGGRTYYSMPLTDPRCVWFVDQTEVGALLEHWASDK